MEALNKKKDEATVLLPISNIYIKYQRKASWYLNLSKLKDSASYPQLQNPWRILSSIYTVEDGDLTGLEDP